MSTLANSYSSVRPDLISACCLRPTQLGLIAPALGSQGTVAISQSSSSDTGLPSLFFFKLPLWECEGYLPLTISWMEGRKKSVERCLCCSWMPPDLLPASPGFWPCLDECLRTETEIAAANSCDPVWSWGAFPDGPTILEYRSSMNQPI